MKTFLVASRGSHVVACHQDRQAAIMEEAILDNNEECKVLFGCFWRQGKRAVEESQIVRMHVVDTRVWTGLQSLGSALWM